MQHDVKILFAVQNYEIICMLQIKTIVYLHSLKQITCADVTSCLSLGNAKCIELPTISRECDILSLA